ncbi:MAG: glycoside hydrolase family 5 protein [Candidatus Hydrogenedentes bacterium]|nr:glycoside hydrolase family 5 protein [Candidatus Hydrogenedentota bacterium]
MSASFVVFMALAAGPVLGVDSSRFTLDERPAFLLGISYYGALAIEDKAIVAGDLDEMKALGFNWVRVWVTWNAFENNVSAVAPDGSVRRPYMDRLLRLCKLAGTRGMVVDVTVTRGKAPDFPSTMAEHEAVMQTLARELKPYRNVYFDVGNERNVGDERHVPMSEVGRLVESIKRIDPDRLCTASQGGDISDEEFGNYLETGKVDFVAPHRGRYAGSAAETGETTRHYLDLMKGGRIVPVLYQEPFRRGYADWEPKADDFRTDLEQSKASGAAGWCFHNGSVRSGKGDERPRRSFDLRPEEGRLFDQFDAEERAFLDSLKKR